MKNFAGILLTACVGLVSPIHAAVSPYFECDFEKGIPEEFTLIDRDARDLHFTMVQLGFDDKDSWITLREEGTENYYAASASRFKTSKGEAAAQADDWLITPPVWIRASDAKLTWRGMSVNERNSKMSSYEVLISTEGTSPENFISSPLAVVDGEQVYEWTSHEADLSEYVGQRIYIAFVNKSTDSDVLAIDDICVEGSSGLADLEIFPGEYTLGNEEITFGGILTACSDETVNTLSVTFLVGEDTYHAEYDNLDLHSGEQFEFVLPETLSASYGDMIPFTVKSEINGIPFDDMQLHTMLLAFQPTKRVVVEEATGMWCGYCPEGIVAMETLQKRYPEEFIGVAIHVNDAMEVKGYGDIMSFPSGAPTAWVDRKQYCESLLTPVYKDGNQTYTTLMGGIESMLVDRLSEQAFADVEVSGNYDDSSQDVTVDMSVKFAKRYSDCDFRIVMVLTEDNVWKEGYYQTNYHAGRDEVLDGFESLPPMIVENFAFNHVARWASDPYNGVAGFIPAIVEPATVYDYSMSFALPSSVINLENVRIIAMVTDFETGEIMNAATSNVKNSGIETVEKGGISVRARDGVISAYSEGEVEMTVFSVSGILAGRVSGSGMVSKGELSPGIYIVNVVSGDCVKTVKVII
ncbi:MAG: Omp28-related outer membrane protein [Bacteroides sp.]|nr:Omp28-related outer membrane protein [Bacteroides sp.]